MRQSSPAHFLGMALLALTATVAILAGCAGEEATGELTPTNVTATATPKPKPTPAPSPLKLLGNVTTFAGDDTSLITSPGGVVLGNGGVVFVADTGANCIRRIANGTVDFLAGSEQGMADLVDKQGSLARFNGPTGMVFNLTGDVLFVADTGNQRIRAVDLLGHVTTFAGGPGGVAFNHPSALALDAQGNVYVADTDNHAIRRVTPLGGVTTFAGGTQGAPEATESLAAKFSSPSGVAVNAAGDVFVADTGNNVIRKITDGHVTTFAGSGAVGAADSSVGGSVGGTDDGPGSSASFNAPGALRLDDQGNLYVLDVGNQRIRKITPTGVVSTLAGGTIGYQDGVGTSAQFSGLAGLEWDRQGALYVADKGNGSIRKVTVPGGRVTTFIDNFVSVDGTLALAHFNQPTYLAIDSQGALYATDTNNHQIRKIAGGVVTTLAGSTKGYQDGATSSAQFNSPAGLAVDGAGNVYVADSGNHCIRRIDPSGTVSTVAGGTKGFADGPGSTARFNTPTGLALDAQANLYVADTLNLRIRKIASDGSVSTVAGMGGAAEILDGAALSAKFYQPTGLAIDSSGSLYVTEDVQHCIRKIAGGIVSTYAGLSHTAGNLDGPLAQATFQLPKGLLADAVGNLFVADYGNHRIRRISTTGTVNTVAGSDLGFVNDKSISARFSGPVGLAYDPASGSLYVGDSGNRRIRKIQ